MYIQCLLSHWERVMVTAFAWKDNMSILCCFARPPSPPISCLTFGRRLVRGKQINSMKVIINTR